MIEIQRDTETDKEKKKHIKCKNLERKEKWVMKI